jgi:hypothetical protein
MMGVLCARGRRAIAAYTVFLLLETVCAKPVLKHEIHVNADIPGGMNVSDNRTLVEQPVMDVPEPATYVVVGTVLIAFSAVMHMVRRRRAARIYDRAADAAEAAPTSESVPALHANR